MTTTTLSWFYRNPEADAYAISERLRTSFWDARLTNLWLDCTRAEAPFLAVGQTGETKVTLEWMPGRWLTLHTTPTGQHVADAVSFLLKFKPAFRYRDVEGAMVWEWHTDGGNNRWQEIQGKPSFHAPLRLNK